MKIVLEKSILVSALDTVSKAAPVGKSTMPILEGVLLKAEGKKLCLTCNNLETSIQNTIECDVIEPGSLVVNTKLFSDIIKKMPDEEIDIFTNEKEMTIEAEKAVMKISILNAAGFPEIPKIVIEESFEMDQQTLRDMIGKVAFSAAMTEERPALTGILINISCGVMDAVTIDGAMMALRKTETNAKDIKILVLARVLETISRILNDGKMKINLSLNQAMIETDTLKISLPLLNYEYTAYKNMIPKEYKTTVKIKTRDMQSAIERSLLVYDSTARDITKPLIITTTVEGVRMVFEGVFGQFNEEIAGTVAGGIVKVGFDPRRINECLKRIEDTEIMMNLVGDSMPCIFTPVNGDRFLYFISPVRLKG